MATKFRTSFTHTQGHDAAKVVQGRIVNVNTTKWTVDVVGQFDRTRYFGIQVGAPYAHYVNGEGFYAMPEVGAACMVCLPSDSSPPFVLSYVMPHAVVDDASDDAPVGTKSRTSARESASDVSFAGNRPAMGPGDIGWRGRDGNFVILHRGGVLQLGATELSQRIFLPLRNLMVDVSENYEHHNTGGSITWGLQDVTGAARAPSQQMQTFRVFADDRYADLRVARGRIYHPLGEPDGGVAQASAGIQGGDDNPIVYEVALSPTGFVAESGDAAAASTVPNCVLRYVFDRQGNTFFRSEGNVTVKIAKKLSVQVAQGVDLQLAEGATLTAAKGLDLNGGTYAHIKGDIVRMGQGVIPVARLGDIVSTIVAGSPVLIQFASTPTPGVPMPALLTTTAPLIGSVSSANQQVLA